MEKPTDLGRTVEPTPTDTRTLFGLGLPALPTGQDRRPEGIAATLPGPDGIDLATRSTGLEENAVSVGSFTQGPAFQADAPTPTPAELILLQAQSNGDQPALHFTDEHHPGLTPAATGAVRQTGKTQTRGFEPRRRSGIHFDIQSRRFTTL